MLYRKGYHVRDAPERNEGHRMPEVFRVLDFVHVLKVGPADMGISHQLIRAGTTAREHATKSEHEKVCCNCLCTDSAARHLRGLAPSWSRCSVSMQDSNLQPDMSSRAAQSGRRNDSKIKHMLERRRG